jgi:hypothetical protein
MMTMRRIANANPPYGFMFYPAYGLFGVMSTYLESTSLTLIAKTDLKTVFCRPVFDSVHSIRAVEVAKHQCVDWLLVLSISGGLFNYFVE